MNEKEVLNDKVWFGVNRNGNFIAFIDEPKRNEKLGIWEGKYPFIGCSIYNQLKDLVEKSKMNWENDVEMIIVK